MQVARPTLRLPCLFFQTRTAWNILTCILILLTIITGFFGITFVAQLLDSFDAPLLRQSTWSKPLIGQLQIPCLNITSRLHFHYSNLKTDEISHSVLVYTIQNLPKCRKYGLGLVQPIAKLLSCPWHELWSLALHCGNATAVLGSMGSACTCRIDF